MEKSRICGAFAFLQATSPSLATAVGPRVGPQPHGRRRPMCPTASRSAAPPARRRGGGTTPRGGR